MNWTEQATSTHQDHVIAHVIGATVLGHFVFDESIYLLLDIGFFWQVYLDGEMGLLPYAVAIDELEADSEVKKQLGLDSHTLLEHQISTEQTLKQLIQAPAPCLINEVTFYVNGENWRLVMRGEENDLQLEASLATRDFIFSRCSE